jgi:hypothetical protein
MGRRKVVLTSNVHNFRCLWCAGTLSEENLVWARNNLVKGADGKCAFERRLDFRRDVRTCTAPPLLPQNFPARVDFKSDDAHPWVLVQLGARYDLHQKFEKAQSERDPELAPHVIFRKLLPGDDASALKFIQEFGPLFLNDMSRNPIVWIDLNDFWRRHARFVAIVRLYEALNDCESLRKALVDIVENRQNLDSAGPAEIGLIPDTGKDTPFVRFVYLQASQDFGRVDEDGDLTWNHQALRHHAREIIRAELILQTFDGIRSGWERIDEEDGLGFCPTLIVTSLWAALWEMFGLDTARGYGWNSCKFCRKYFYPYQGNSECCSPEHQALWSKRVWATKSRAAKKSSAPLRKP